MQWCEHRDSSHGYETFSTREWWRRRNRTNYQFIFIHLCTVLLWASRVSDDIITVAAIMMVLPCTPGTSIRWLTCLKCTKWPDHQIQVLYMYLQFGLVIKCNFWPLDYNKINFRGYKFQNISGGGPPDSLQYQQVQNTQQLPLLGGVGSLWAWPSVS